MKTDDVSVRQLMSSPVRSVDGRTAVAEAARILCDERIGSVLIHAHDDGILTDTDIVRTVKAGRDPEQTMVSEVMTSPVVTIEPDASVRAATEQMTDRGIKKLPVESAEEYVGIVTTTDVVGHLSPELDDVIEMFVND